MQLILSVLRRRISIFLVYSDDILEHIQSILNVNFSTALRRLFCLSVFKRFIANKLCTAFSRTNKKIIPVNNLNKRLYSGKNEIKVNVNYYICYK